MTTETTTIISTSITAGSTLLGVLITLLKSSADKKELKERIKEIESTTRDLEKEKIRFLTEIPLTLKKGVYYDKDSNAYCPACRAKSLFVPLSLLKKDETKIVYKCPNCDVYFDIFF